MTNEHRSNQATLGCGTLILIAIIVMFFSNTGTDELSGHVKKLRSDVQELTKTVETQTAKIDQLQKQMDRLQPNAAIPAVEDQQQ